MWEKDSVIYQIYPLGLTASPKENDYKVVNRLKKIEDFIDHIYKLNINAVYFCPVFQSTRHGYDTIDYTLIDNRLGTNEDFKNLIKKFHDKGIRVIIDGVFNHVGRDFIQFQDVLKNRENSKYRYWFNIDFGGNSNYNDGLWYEGWEGHYDLVKLNLNNDEVVCYLLECVKRWIEEFDIDGIRLDVAYLLDHNFIRRLRQHVDSLKDDFFLVGEMLHGDYNVVMNDEMLDSVTNYECYKGLYSSFNSLNMFEIAHSLNRQFGPEEWTLYKGKHLLNFVDNHDVTRIASILNDKNHLKLIYGLLFTMSGIPSIYYASEWGEKGRKEDGDDALRVAVDKPIQNELTSLIARLSKIKREEKALKYGDYNVLFLTNKQYAFVRCFEGEKIIFMVNIDSNEFTINYDIGAKRGTDLLTEEETELGCTRLDGYSMKIIKVMG